MYKIAIQPDRIRHKNGELQSFSERWAELATQAGVEVRRVDAFAPDLFDQLAGCDGFMWRFGYTSLPRLFARRLLPAIEHGLGIPVFPSWKTAWHFEDKVAQHYLLQAAGIPTPRTWVFWRRDDALAFSRGAQYPLVLKLTSGFQSGNVRLLHGAKEAEYWIDRLFGPGIVSLAPPPGPRTRRLLRQTRAAVRMLFGRMPRVVNWRDELHHGYFYAQEFLAGNEFDTRVAVIGKRAFAFRRFNRPGDFRASGSGQFDWNPVPIDPAFVRLAFRISQQLQMQSVAIDGLRRGEEPVIGEISYSYASWTLRDCPGHWELNGDPDMGQLNWVEGQMRPEDAIWEDFLAEIGRREP